MKTILIAAFSDLSKDSRVLRQIKFLSGKYRLVTMGHAACGTGDAEFVGIEPFGRGMGRKICNGLFLLSGLFERFYWGLEPVKSLSTEAEKLTADLIIANDIETLPALLRYSRGTPVLFDAHEYYPDQWNGGLLFNIFYRRYFGYLCRKYMPGAAAVTTVSSGIQERYNDDFGVGSSVITNAVEYEDVVPSDNRKSGRIRIVHHGGANPARKIENLIKMMKLLDERFELYLMLTRRDGPYFEKLKSLALGDERINFIPPVRPERIAVEIGRFDVGIHLLPPTSFNAQNALPNKFFEFVQARLAVAVGPTKEMAGMVKKYDLGVVSDDFSPEAMARALGGLDPEKVHRYKTNSHRAALRLSCEDNRLKFTGLVEEILNAGSPSLRRMPRP